MLVFFRDGLNAEFIFGIRARFDRFPQIAAVKIGVFTRNSGRLVPQNRMQSEQRFSVKFNEMRFVIGVCLKSDTQFDPVYFLKSGK